MKIYRRDRVEANDPRGVNISVIKPGFFFYQGCQDNSFVFGCEVDCQFSPLVGPKIEFV